MTTPSENKFYSIVPSNDASNLACPNMFWNKEVWKSNQLYIFSNVFNEYALP